MNSHIKLTIAAILPSLLSVLFILLNDKTSFKNINKTIKQIIYGISFGILAILGTEWGIPINGAQMNVRDGAVVTAGLLFGTPAGIIAGLIGGIERYFSVYWGISAFTQIACSISTIIAGFYSGFLRKYMFDDKKPSPQLAFAVGMVMEVFHMVMVFLTNMNEVEKAMQVVAACSLIMISANSLSVLLSTIIAYILTNNSRLRDKVPTISQTFQRWLLICVAITFILSTTFMSSLQDGINDNQYQNILSLAINDVEQDIKDASDNNLLVLNHKAISMLEDNNINEICKLLGLSEINIVDSKGIIIDSTNPDYFGFDMTNSEQSAEFLVLLGNQTEFVQEFRKISFDNKISFKYSGVKYKTGFVQVGYDALAFQASVAEQVKNLTKNRHVGSTGYIVIANLNRNVVSSLDGFSFKTLSDYGFGFEDQENEVFIETVNNESCLCMYKFSEGYYICAVIPEKEAYQVKNIVIYATLFMEILVFALMFALIYFLLKKSVVNKINDVNLSLAKITNGNLNEVVNVRSNKEFIYLSDDINHTVNVLKNYIAEASARIDAELEYAKTIQDSSLPHVFPKNDSMEIYASMRPAKEVGGDFYDFYDKNQDSLNFVIADVSGKGIPGAMFMMRAKSVIHSLTERGLEVNEVFTIGNSSLCEGNDAGMFVTAWEGRIDFKTGIVKYVNAGHNPPVVKHFQGSCEYVKSKPGFVLAGFDNIKYISQEIKLEKGDVLFLYTDGVVEATNSNKELYGENRLLEILNGIDKDEKIENICRIVVEDVDKFVGDAEQFDDITILAIKYLGE